MFHIKPDKRSQASAALLVEGLYACLEDKPFSQITITDLQRTSSVGRATFYRLFDSLPDVLAYECDNIFLQLIKDGHEMQTLDSDKAFTCFFTYWTGHLSLLKAIFESGHMEIIYNTFRSHADDIGSIMMADLQEPEEYIDYLVSVLTSAFMGIIAVWMQHGKNCTAEELTAIFKKTLSSICQR